MRFLLMLLACGILAAQNQTVVTVGGPVVSPTSPSLASPTAQPQTAPEDLCSVEGTVTNAATGAPVRKAMVLMNRTEITPSPNAFPVNYSTTTDTAGKFAMKDIEPGRYRITVSRVGFVTMSYGARAPNRPGTVLALERAQKIKDVNLRLTPHGVVTGRILDEDGEPLPNVSLFLVRFQKRQGRQQENVGGNGMTNDLGEFRIFGVVPGKYYLRANGRAEVVFNAQDHSVNAQPEEDYVPTYYPGTIDPATATPIEVGRNSSVGPIG